VGWGSSKVLSKTDPGKGGVTQLTPGVSQGVLSLHSLSIGHVPRPWLRPLLSLGCFSEQAPYLPETWSPAGSQVLAPWVLLTHALCLLKGATVLFLNATDLDRSREYGQESIIYSLEGSSQFRINARSGEPPSMALHTLRLPHCTQSGTSPRARVSSLFICTKLTLST
jgi:hypothetical protein